jgi:allantoicase
MSKKIIFSNGIIDLAQPRLGSKIIFKTDDFFASSNRIIDPLPPVFKEGLFDKNGKWMDGWESRRKRTPGHDFLIIKLGKPGSINKVNIDTSHFNGNQPSMVSLEGCNSKSKIIKNFKWKTLIGKKKTKANSHHIFSTSSKLIFTHIKLNIFPDGGVARLRLYGNISKENNNLGSKTINLASLLNGASVIACNNEHFGKAENILAPGKAKNMGDGWETRRRRDKGFDWLILNSIKGRKIDKIEISTHHFKGNFPSHCSLQAAFIPSKKSSLSIVKNSNKWKFLMNKVNLSANKTHTFTNTLMINNKINFIKINIFPDGGISRFKIFGKSIL